MPNCSAFSCLLFDKIFKTLYNSKDLVTINSHIATMAILHDNGGRDMEVCIRDVKIRGEVEYIIDSGNNLAISTQLTLLMKASYNSLLTNPDVVKQMPEWEDYIEALKNSVEQFLSSTSNL